MPWSESKGLKDLAGEKVLNAMGDVLGRLRFSGVAMVVPERNEQQNRLLDGLRCAAGVVSGRERLASVSGGYGEHTRVIGEGNGILGRIDQGDRAGLDQSSRSKGRGLRESDGIDGEISGCGYRELVNDLSVIAAGRVRNDNRIREPTLRVRPVNAGLRNNARRLGVDINEVSGWIEGLQRSSQIDVLDGLDAETTRPGEFDS